MFDLHTNLALASVTVAPSPATSGTTFSMANGDAAMFPDPAGSGNTAYNVVFFPTGVNPTQATGEIGRITAKGAADSGGAGHTQFTIARTQESSGARTVIVGDQVMIGNTKQSLLNIEAPLLNFFPFVVSDRKSVV